MILSNPEKHLMISRLSFCLQIKPRHVLLDRAGVSVNVLNSAYESTVFWLSEVNGIDEEVHQSPFTKVMLVDHFENGNI